FSIEWLLSSRYCHIPYDKTAREAIPFMRSIQISSILASIEGTYSAGSMECQRRLSIQSLVQRIKRPPDRYEKRLAKFFHVEILNHRLGGGRDHEISKRFAASGIDFWTVRRIHLHDGIEVQQASVALNQNRQRQPVEEGQVSPVVADRVGASVIGDVERRPHSLTRLNVPSPLWRNTGGLPKGFFETVGAGIITPGDKRRM